jgi:hypothetical protein
MWVRIIPLTFQSASPSANQILKALPGSVVFEQHQGKSKLITELDIETSETCLVLLVKVNQFTNYGAVLPFIMNIACFVNVGRKNIPQGSKAFVSIRLQFYTIIYIPLLA